MPFRGKGYRPPRYTPQKYTPPRSSGNDAYKYRGRGYRAAPPPIQDERQEAVAAYGNAQYERQIRVNPMLYNISQTSKTAFKNNVVKPFMNAMPNANWAAGVAHQTSNWAANFINRNGLPLSNATATGTPHNVPWGAGVAPSEHGVRKPQPKGTLSYTPPPDTGASTDTGYGGYYPYYGGGGGGGYDYSGSSYSSPFTQYQPGYAAQGSQAPAAMGMRTAPQQAPYRSNYATANQQARWLSLLTNWRI